jgi:4-amino-4-deoxy-L-arabinose transferase-like glycosyltransferase
MAMSSTAGEKGIGRGAGLSRIFLVALAVRWCYALALYLFMGDRGLTNEDSLTYLRIAHEFLSAVSANEVHGLGWLGLDPWLMPLFYWCIVAFVAVFGSLAPIAYVLMQGVLDAATCVVVFHIAQTINPDYARKASWCSVFNPTQIILSGIFFTDTPFLFFASLSLLGSLRWLRSPSRNAAALIAAGTCGAFFIRVLIAPWMLVIFLFLAAAGLLRGRRSAKDFMRLCGVGALMAFCVGAVVARNVAQFGAFSLTPQGGYHLALWVVPLVKESQDRTPWAETFNQLRRQRQERYGDPPKNEFELTRQLRTVAQPELEKLTLGAVAKAWFTGIALNLVSPSTMISPPVYYLPRTGFYATPGTSLLDKCLNFLFHSGNALHAWITLIGVAGLLAARVVQLAGIFEIVRHRERFWPAAFCSLWVMYILAVNGPIASPKYRLPIEPVLMIACGAGLHRLLRGRPVTA